MRGRNDTGSLPVAMLLALVALSLSTLIFGTVLNQNTITRSEAARGAALNAAQTGIDVGLAQIRAANDGAGAGVLSRLPCTAMTGAAELATPKSATYRVQVRYYAEDPQNQTEPWLTTKAITCIPGGGTARTPVYALIQSLGEYPTNASAACVPAAQTCRSLAATYTFRLSNENIPGGQIHAYRAATGDPDLCFDAGSGSPAVSTVVTLQTCSPGDGAQTWAYNTNLTLTLVSSKTELLPLGLCLDAGKPHAAGKPVALQRCSSTTQPQQQWSINDSGNFEGTTDGSALDGYCFNAESPGQRASRVVLGSASDGNCRRSYNARQSFFPDASVGPGAAGAAVGQLVDLKQFGRCLDVTDQNVNASFLIAWACKQAPIAANVAWNQRWSTPKLSDAAAGVQGLVTTNRGGLYCLRSPLVPGAGRYVRIVGCTASTTAAEVQWTLFGNTADYAASYTLVDSAGYCLSPTDPDANPPDLFSAGQQVSKVTVAVCDGSPLQKWNAPVSSLQARPLKGLNES